MPRPARLLEINGNIYAREPGSGRGYINVANADDRLSRRAAEGSAFNRKFLPPGVRELPANARGVIHFESGAVSGKGRLKKNDTLLQTLKAFPRGKPVIIAMRGQFSQYTSTRGEKVSWVSRRLFVEDLELAARDGGDLPGLAALLFSEYNGGGTGGVAQWSVSESPDK